MKWRKRLALYEKQTPEEGEVKKSVQTRRSKESARKKGRMPVKGLKKRGDVKVPDQMHPKLEGVQEQTSSFTTTGKLPGIHLPDNTKELKRLD